MIKIQNQNLYPQGMLDIVQQIQAWAPNWDFHVGVPEGLSMATLFQHGVESYPTNVNLMPIHPRILEAQTRSRYWASAGQNTAERLTGRGGWYSLPLSNLARRIVDNGETLSPRIASRFAPEEYVSDFLTRQNGAYDVSQVPTARWCAECREHSGCMHYCDDCYDTTCGCLGNNEMPHDVWLNNSPIFIEQEATS